MQVETCAGVYLLMAEGLVLVFGVLEGEETPTVGLCGKNFPLVKRGADNSGRCGQGLATVAETDDPSIEMRLEIDMGVVSQVHTAVDESDLTTIVKNATVLVKN